MYAIIKTGGKQYRVSPGDVLRVEKLTGATGSTVEFPALAVAAHLGVAVGRRRRSALPAIKRLLAARWPPPAGLVRFFRSMHACGAAEAYPPLLAAAISSEGR